MRKLAFLGGVLLLGGCVSVGSGGKTTQQLSDEYNNCVFKGVNIAYGNGTKGDAAIDQAISGCKSAGNAYGAKLAADAGIPAEAQWEIGMSQMLPLAEKKTREYFQDYLKRHGG